MGRAGTLTLCGHQDTQPGLGPLGPAGDSSREEEEGRTGLSAGFLAG